MTEDRVAVWWALIGPLPAPITTGIIQTPHDRSRALAGPTTVGPLRLRPGGKLLAEYQRSEPSALEGVTTFESWPVIVEGYGPLGDDPGPLGPPSENPGSKAAHRAAADLHRLCCFVSLAWQEPWQVRTAPTGADRLPPCVPDSWPPPPRPWPIEDESLPAVGHDLPEWLGRAWSLPQADSYLASALSFWHQGMLMTPSFPSFALAAFTASIEAMARTGAIAASLGEAPHACKECGNVPRASARFWEAVGLVATPDEVTALRKQERIYSLRSETAHGAALHGTETIFGSIFMLDYRLGPTPSLRIDETDPAQTFVLRTLPALRAVATGLLLRTLTAGGPSFTDAPNDHTHR